MPRGRPKGQHGGYRKPGNPAPVSAPGAASSRTDGGPSQPVRPIPAENHGDRQASVDLQQAAPLAAGGDTQVAVAPQGPPPPGAPAADPFGPTRRLNEPLTAGAMLGAGAAPNPQQNVRDWLSEQFREFQTDAFLDMLEELDEELGY